MKLGHFANQITRSLQASLIGAFSGNCETSRKSVDCSTVQISVLILTPQPRHGQHPKVGHDRLRLSAAAARQKWWLQNNRILHNSGWHLPGAVQSMQSMKQYCSITAGTGEYCLCNTAALQPSTALCSGAHLVLQEVTVDNQCSAVINWGFDHQ